MEKLEGVELTDVLKETTEEMLKEKKLEIRNKIRHVFGQIGIFQNEIKRLQEQISKKQEQLEKAKTKLEQVKSGNWSILDSINPNEGDQK